MVKVFSSKHCPECLVVKNYLLALGVKFEEVTVDSPKIAEYIEKKTGMRKVPVVESEKGVVVGLKLEKIKRLVC